MSNSERRFRIEFGIEMLPAMLHALSLARCTAMMCAGHGERSVYAAFDEQYRALVAQIGGSGDDEELRSGIPDEYAWWRVCTAMRSAKRYHFHEYCWKPSKYDTMRPRDAGRVWPVIDGKSHDLGRGHVGDVTPWLAFREALELLAPLDAVREQDVAERREPEDRRS